MMMVNNNNELLIGKLNMQINNQIESNHNSYLSKHFLMTRPSHEKQAYLRVPSVSLNSKTAPSTIITGVQTGQENTRMVPKRKQLNEHVMFRNIFAFTSRKKRYDTPLRNIRIKQPIKAMIFMMKMTRSTGRQIITRIYRKIVKAVRSFGFIGYSS